MAIFGYFRVDAAADDNAIRRAVAALAEKADALGDRITTVYIGGGRHPAELAAEMKAGDRLVVPDLAHLGDSLADLQRTVRALLGAGVTIRALQGARGGLDVPPEAAEALLMLLSVVGGTQHAMRSRRAAETAAARKAAGLACGYPPLGKRIVRRNGVAYLEWDERQLRRYVVERCIYGVDLNPLAIELCRLSLWIETLDRRLPFTFLEHKVKPGNSLVGAWFDQFLHYPVMAWEREGGDKTHTNGVHYQKEQGTKAIRERKKNVRDDLIKFIDGAQLVYTVDLASVQTVHDEAEKALQAIHMLGVHQAEERAQFYREMRHSAKFCRLKDAFDLWCALWFWPADRLDEAPLPPAGTIMPKRPFAARIVWACSKNNLYRFTSAEPWCRKACSASA
jgi:DNA invertase Pin-like site-specific DNA recombinase